MCADRQTSNAFTGEVLKEDTTKIKKWSSTIAVGGCGYAKLSESVMDYAPICIEENGGLGNYALEEIGELFCELYRAAFDDVPEMPQNINAQWAIAGRLSNGTLGVIQVFVQNGKIDKDIHIGTPTPKTLIFGPGDISDNECGMLYAKAMRFFQTKKPKHNMDIQEAIHRKAVSYVAERSRFVGSKSDYLTITLGDCK